MLVRISKQLILTGRCLEHAELMASITKVYYLSAMDGPFPAYSATVWSFILKVNQASEAYARSYPHIEQENILQFVALAAENPASIRSLVVKARELAREARSCISAELWEHINSYYHKLQAYPAEKLQQKGFYRFAQKVEQFSYTLKGYLDTVMLRNETWELLSLGYHLERALLANTLLLYTLQEAEKGKTTEQAGATGGDYLMRALLEGLGAYEMYKQYYQAQVNQADFIHFLMFNKAYPRSMLYNLHCIGSIHNQTGIGPAAERSSLQQIANLAAAAEAHQAANLQQNSFAYLAENLKKLQAISAEITAEAQLI